MKVWLVGLYLFLRIEFCPILIWKDIQIVWYKTCITWTKCHTEALKWNNAKLLAKIERMDAEIRSLS